MANIEIQAAACSVPNGAVPIRRATTTSVEVWAIPAAWLGRFVAFHVHSADPLDRCFIRFGTANTVTVSPTAVSALAANVLTANASSNEPHLVVEAGATEHEWIDGSWTHMAFTSGAATGFLSATLRTGDGT